MENNMNAAANTNTNTINAPAIAVGAILECSWGYEQTNIDFYEVVKVTKASVVLRKIASECVRETGWASAEVVPVPGKYVGKEFRRRFSCDGRGRVSCRIESYSWATTWDGKPAHQTSYA
jgi:hypothetical protein